MRAHLCSCIVIEEMNTNMIIRSILLISLLFVAANAEIGASCTSSTDCAASETCIDSKCAAGVQLLEGHLDDEKDHEGHEGHDHEGHDHDDHKDHDDHDDHDDHKDHDHDDHKDHDEHEGHDHNDHKDHDDHMHDDEHMHDDDHEEHDHDEDKEKEDMQTEASPEPADEPCVSTEWLKVNGFESAALFHASSQSVLCVTGMPCGTPGHMLRACDKHTQNCRLVTYKEHCAATKLCTRAVMPVSQLSHAFDWSVVRAESAYNTLFLTSVSAHPESSNRLSISRAIALVADKMNALGYGHLCDAVVTLVRAGKYGYKAAFSISEAAKSEL